MAMNASPVLLLWTADSRVLRSLEAVAGEHGLAAKRSDGADPADEPAVVVVDLDAPGAFEALTDVRDRWPEALVAGHLGLPDRDRWLAAERAGCDLVANRGALASALRKRLASGGTRRGRRAPLFALNDAAGRLGCVHRETAGTTVDDAIAVYHIGSRFHACADYCPHAGALISEGEVERGVVTCPRHGSQFEVATGLRVRGPADTDITTYPTVEDGGMLYLLVAD
ncbi:MAG TPA: Rieske 2Fe-2S domain-containing protein [Acidimicrobiia bacterium]|nr:Rieske 2Fe-2S domain-containing protein [Acidimicrobiia bacterium]